MQPAVEEIIKREWREGMSAGAVARQVCRCDCGSMLKRLFEEMLDDANRAGHEFSEQRDVLRDCLSMIPKN